MSGERIPKEDSVLIWAGAILLGGGILGVGLWFFWPWLRR